MWSGLWSLWGSVWGGLLEFSGGGGVSSFFVKPASLHGEWRRVSATLKELPEPKGRAEKYVNGYLVSVQ